MGLAAFNRGPMGRLCENGQAFSNVLAFGLLYMITLAASNMGDYWGICSFTKGD